MADKTNTGKMGLRQRWNQSREKNKFFRFFTGKYVLATIAFIIFIFFFTEKNMLSWGGHLLNVYKQDQLIHKYRNDIKGIDEKLLELESNKDSLEKFAREQYYFQEKGEDVYILK